MKTLPKQKRARRKQIDSLKGEVARWKRALTKFTPGKLPHQTVSQKLAHLEQELKDLQRHPNAV